MPSPGAFFPGEDTDGELVVGVEGAARGPGLDAQPAREAKWCGWLRLPPLLAGAPS
jgi:hypothetical protein